MPNCTSCGSRERKILETRRAQYDYIRRRCECLSCGKRFTTLEIPIEQLEITPVRETDDTRSEGQEQSEEVIG
jgi:transcriptional regulator NrdR family protein